MGSDTDVPNIENLEAAIRMIKTAKLSGMYVHSQGEKAKKRLVENIDIIVGMAKEGDADGWHPFTDEKQFDKTVGLMKEMINLL